MFQRSSLLAAAILLCGFLAVAPAEEPPFFFIQLSDPQLGMFTADAEFSQDTANFEFAVAAVNRLKPAFVIITGDLVNKPGDAAQTAEYKRITGRVAPGIAVYHVAGNHDVGNAPTPESVAAWKAELGADRYSFRHKGFAGIVLNSNIIFAPEQTPELYAEQMSWLRAELEKARAEKVRHIAVFQHHPWFLKTATEPDSYFNIPLERRAPHLALFHEFAVSHLFCGHYHRNALARDAEIEAVTSGPVGKPLGDGKSGLRVVIVREDRIEHRYYDFGELPTRVELGEAKAEPRSASRQ